MTTTATRSRPELRRARRRLGLSQSDLAKKLRVTTGAVSLWEAGLRSPGDALLPAIATALSLPVEELLDMLEEPVTPSN